jgi:SAM-dependent methyltransferase
MRPDSYFQASPGRVLDVGCGDGRFGAMLKDKLDRAEVWGIEPVAAAHAAAAKVLDHALAGSFDESLGLPDASFDIVVFNDSLEHFPDTMQPLALARRLLKPDGRVIASIPNARYWPHLRRYVFHGEWRYQDAGILDRTHLRFFTHRSILETFDEAGYAVRRIEGITPCWRGARLAIAKTLLPRAVQDVLYLQFAVVATKRALSDAVA